MLSNLCVSLEGAIVLYKQRKARRKLSLSLPEWLQLTGHRLIHICKQLWLVRKRTTYRRRQDFFRTPFESSRGLHESTMAKRLLMLVYSSRRSTHLCRYFA